MNNKEKAEERRKALSPQGGPKYVRCYDNEGETLDRYTVVFTGNYRRKTGGQFIYLGMSASPFQGIGQHGFSDTQIDRPIYRHLGKRIKFSDLPTDCQKAVLDDYKELWGI